MSDKSPEKKKAESVTDSKSSLEDTSKTNQIVILEERDIPFEEERPPNFSPHYAVKVHKVRKRIPLEDDKE